MIKKYKGLLITVLLTFIMLMYIFYTSSIFDKTLLTSDLNSEYRPLLTQLQNFLQGHVGLYQFNNSLGDNFIGNFYYYLSSPFNILVLFIKDINLLVLIQVILKLTLASAFCYLFFKYQFRDKKECLIIAFSLLYTLSSFSISYYLHIMWLDIYMLFPLILLGIDKIINEKKYSLYIISFLLAIFCNYYFAYMIMIFNFLYFNYKIIMKKDKIIKSNGHFIILNLLIILTASVVMIPIINELGTYSRQNSQLFGGEKLTFSFNLIPFIKKFFLGNVDDIDFLNAHDFYLFTSILVVPLIYFYFMNKNIKRKEKALTFIIILILFGSITLNYGNYLWHGFIIPSFFNGRFTFMFILFLLLISLKALYNIDGVKTKHFVFVTLALFLMVLKIELSMYDIIKIVVLVGYLILFRLMTKYKCLNVIFLILSVYELSINGYLYLKRYNFSNKEDLDYHIKDAIKYVKENDKDLFYRIDDNDENSNNYPLLYQYNGIDYFMSTLKKDTMEFFVKMGASDHSYTKNTISYDGSYFILSSLLNMKYYIETKGLNNDIYNFLYQVDNDNIKVYENPYALNLGFMANNRIINTELDYNALNNLNKIYQDTSDISILEKVIVDKTDDCNYTFQNLKKNNFYLFIKFKGWSYYENLNVYINDQILYNTNNSYVYHVENNFPNDTLNIHLSLEEYDIPDIESVYVYYYDMDQFKKAIEKLKTESLIIDKVKRNYIEGKIEVKENNDILFTTIPYDKDIDVYIDGKKTNKYKLLDTFIGIKLEKGKHKITFKYHPKLLYISFILSFLGGILLWMYMRQQKKYYIISLLAILSLKIKKDITHS